MKIYKICAFHHFQNLCNHLSLNIVKSEYMIIGSVQRIRNLSREPSLFIGNVKLKRVKHKKILGVTVGENLGWHEHISNTVKKVKSGLSVLRQIRDFYSSRRIKESILCNYTTAFRLLFIGMG